MNHVDDAAREPGTRRTTNTAHPPRRDVVARTCLAQRDFEDLTPEALEAMRRPAGRTGSARSLRWSRRGPADDHGKKNPVPCFPPAPCGVWTGSKVREPAV